MDTHAMTPNQPPIFRRPSARPPYVTPREPLDLDPASKWLFALVAVVAAFAAAALLTASLLEQSAAESDEASVLRTLRRQQLAAATESRLGAERSAYLRAGAGRAEAGALRTLADQARAEGNTRQAHDLERAGELAAEAAERRGAFTYTARFGTVDEDGAFDAAALRNLLTLDDPAASTAEDPSRYALEADALRRRSRGVSLAIVGLAASIVVLVSAQAAREVGRAAIQRPDRRWRTKMAAALVLAIASITGAVLSTLPPWGG